MTVPGFYFFDYPLVSGAQNMFFPVACPCCRGTPFRGWFKGNQKESHPFVGAPKKDTPWLRCSRRRRIGGGGEASRGRVRGKCLARLSLT